jgi:hypothetical protein
MREKKYFLWHDICYCHIGRAFGMRFAVPAILAVFGRRLPFWQLSAIVAPVILAAAYFLGKILFS